MVIVSLKSMDELSPLLRGSSRVAVLGCAGCSAVCLGGGQREVDDLVATLKNNGSEKRDYISTTVERMCDPVFVSDLDTYIAGCDVVLSMACGAGTQMVAEKFTAIRIFPAVNTVCIGVHRGIGIYEERCRACGNCVLAYTGGICPVTSCAKSLFNGPCGGPRDGICEVGNDVPCAWCMIHERLTLQGRLDYILSIHETMKWQNGIQATVIQEGFNNIQTGKRRSGK